MHSDKILQVLLLRFLRTLYGSSKCECLRHLLSHRQHTVASFVRSHCTSVIYILIFGTDGLTRIYHEEGPRGWWKGTSMALFGVTNGALQFMFYEEMKKRAFVLQKARKEGDGGPWDQNKEKLVRGTSGY